jgi:large exoprotein involved in heme utilization and adhesion
MGAGLRVGSGATTNHARKPYQLQFDPATSQKRIGDGFYAQKLVREQVQALTGQRFLGD